MGGARVVIPAKDDLSLSPIASGYGSQLGLREQFCTEERLGLVSNRLAPAPAGD